MESERRPGDGAEAAGGSGWTVGFHAVLGALQGGRAVTLVLVQQGRRDRRARHLLDAARELGVPTRLVPRARLDEVAAGLPHNGCAARCEAVRLHRLEELIATPGEPGRLLLLDDVADPHNLGAVVRSAAAFAVDGVVVGGFSSPPLSGAAATAAAGHLGRVRLARAKVAADALASLRRAGYWVLAGDAAGGPLPAARPVARWVLCVGGEQRGLRAKTRHQVDEWLRIPMAPAVESLNLSVAAGILLYELCVRWPAAPAGG